MQVHVAELCVSISLLPCKRTQTPLSSGWMTWQDKACLAGDILTGGCLKVTGQKGLTSKEGMCQDDAKLADGDGYHEGANAKPGPPTLGHKSPAQHDAISQCGARQKSRQVDRLALPPLSRELIYDDGPLGIEDGIDPAEPSPARMYGSCSIKRCLSRLSPS